MNAAIHILMYLYYGLASCGPKIQKYLWWKKYLTIIQMVRRPPGLACRPGYRGSHLVLLWCRSEIGTDPKTSRSLVPF